MSKEAFAVSLEKANYHRPVKGGDVGAVLRAREQETKGNILGYLGEYRLAVKFDEIFYRVGVGPTGEKFLAASEEEPISQKFRKAIFQREKEGKDSRREVAECIGFEKIEEAFLRGEEFLFLWISPEGKKEDGYGYYSFTFIGEVKDNRVRIIPYRNQLSLAEHREVANIFSKESERLKTDVDFLANPIFIKKQAGIRNAQDILLQIGEKERMDLSWKQKLEAKVGSLINLFIDGIKRNAPDLELERVKRAIENLTLDKKTEIAAGEFSPPIYGSAYLVETYGRYAPPPVGGSCGSSSSSTLKEFHSEFNSESDALGEREFPCPECKKMNRRPYNEKISHCQHCGSDKVAC